MTKFYHWFQNNSHGRDEPPATVVIVEADNGQEAEEVLFEIGGYFDGVKKGIDCECCGDRWRKTSDVVDSYPNIPVLEFYLKKTRNNYELDYKVRYRDQASLPCGVVIRTPNIMQKNKVFAMRFPSIPFDEFYWGNLYYAVIIYKSQLVVPFYYLDDTGWPILGLSEGS